VTTSSIKKNEEEEEESYMRSNDDTEIESDTSECETPSLVTPPSVLTDLSDDVVRKRELMHALSLVELQTELGVTSPSTATSPYGVPHKRKSSLSENKKKQAKKIRRSSSACSKENVNGERSIVLGTDGGLTSTQMSPPRGVGCPTQWAPLAQGTVGATQVTSPPRETGGSTNMQGTSTMSSGGNVEYDSMSSRKVRRPSQGTPPFRRMKRSSDSMTPNKSGGAGVVGTGNDCIQSDPSNLTSQLFSRAG